MTSAEDEFCSLNDQTTKKRPLEAKSSSTTSSMDPRPEHTVNSVFALHACQVGMG